MTKLQIIEYQKSSTKYNLLEIKFNNRNHVDDKIAWGVSRLIQNKFFRILRDAERICVWVFKAYFVKMFFFLKCISSDNSAENRFLGRFQPWLWRITAYNRKKKFKSIFFYILSWIILRLSKKENPDLSQNWPEEKLLKLTDRKSVLKTGFWAVFRPDFLPVNFDSFSWGQFWLKSGFSFLDNLRFVQLKI